MEPLRVSGGNGKWHPNWPASQQATVSPADGLRYRENQPQASLALQVTQEPGKPPAVVASVHGRAVVTSFETLIGSGEGLKVAVQQAKAAMLYLMDREHFRRLGDVKERQSSLLLLAATTENPDSALLPTFHRRIPMTITLPGLHERTMMERYELLRAFFTTECSGIGANIHA